MQLRLSYLVAILAALVLGVGISGCGSSDDTSSSTASPTTTADGGTTVETAEFKKVLAGAEEEGELNLNWGFSSSDVRPLLDAFREQYPGITVTLTPIQDMPGNTAKMIEEAKADRPASSDAYVAVPELVFAAGPEGADVLEAVDWAAIAPWTKGLAISDGVGVSLFDQYAGFTYNTTQFDEGELPKSAQDVLDLEQPIASTPYAAQFNVLAAPEAMGVKGAEEYVTAFDPAGFIGCGDLSRVASGEFTALWISCGANIGDIFAAQGAPLETVVLDEAAVTFPWYMGIPKNSAHPDAAKLWITWLLTPEAQELLYESEFADNRRIEGSKTEEQIAGYEAQGIEFMEADYDFVVAHPEIYSREFAGELIGLLTEG